MKIVGLLGPAGSGKSTCADHLVAKYGARRFSFAGPLKDIAMRTLDLTELQVRGPQAVKEAVDPRYGFSPRWFLQRLGTEGIRSVFGPDVWWKLCLDTIMREIDYYSGLAVIDDVRFVNEAAGILGADWPSSDLHKVEVWRLDPIAKNSTADESHASEAQWSQAPYTRLVTPQAYGVEYLVEALETCCDQFGLTPTHSVLP